MEQQRPERLRRSAQRAKLATPATWSAGATSWNAAARWLPGDFDGDGFVDLLTVTGSAGTNNTLSTWLTSGASFKTPVSAYSGTLWAASSLWLAGRFY